MPVWLFLTIAALPWVNAFYRCASVELFVECHGKPVEDLTLILVDEDEWTSDDVVQHGRTDSRGYIMLEGCEDDEFFRFPRFYLEFENACCGSSGPPPTTTADTSTDFPITTAVNENSTVMEENRTTTTEFFLIADEGATRAAMYVRPKFRTNKLVLKLEEECERRPEYKTVYY